MLEFVSCLAKRLRTPDWPAAGAVGALGAGPVDAGGSPSLSAPVASLDKWMLGVAPESPTPLAEQPEDVAGYVIPRCVCRRSAIT